MPMKYLLLLGSLFVAGTAAAQQAPSFNCDNAQSSAEELVCSNPKLAQLDRQVDTRFKEALEVVRKLDAGAQEAEKELRAYQRGWIGGRDECWKSDDLESCVRLSYRQRHAELVARYLLEDATAIATWQCGDTPANELVTFFFDTELPSVRIERGDSISVGYISRTASGSRYDADFGRFIWIKGDEAQYREPDPDGTEYSCVAVKG